MGNMRETQMHRTKWKKPVFTGYILYDSDCMIFWKRPNHEDSESISYYWELRREGE